MKESRAKMEENINFMQRRILYDFKILFIENSMKSELTEIIIVIRMLYKIIINNNQYY